MKKLNSFLVIGFLCLVSYTSFAGVVDMRFVNETNNNTTYCATLEIKAQDIPFEIGTSTVFFESNALAVDNASATPINFDAANECNGITGLYDNSFTYLKSNTKGEGNYAILLTQANNGCPTLTSDAWIAVAEFCFDIVDASVTPDLSINTQYTAFNMVDNAGSQHELGDIGGVISSVDKPTITNNQVSIYPNVTANTVNINLASMPNETTNVNVYNMLGQTVVQKTVDANTTAQNVALDLSRYNNGYYLIEVQTGDYTTKEKVLLVK